jgi:hypothetical protein
MDMKLNVMTFGDQNYFQLGGVIRMDLGNIKEVSEVSQNAQKCPTTLRMASAGRKRKKINIPKTPLKQNDHKEHIARFPTVQTACQTELQIKSYKWSKLWSTQSSQQG